MLLKVEDSLDRLKILILLKNLTKIFITEGEVYLYQLQKLVSVIKKHIKANEI